ncbi:tetratricopeptide repeat protein [Acidithiobacillus concretivorus]|uniref:Sel1 repeat family protein n=1 Tax=Acidithiobacillus concretivorus TaxID=3063952 RepID=A0ABS5ZU66_9PROT|nr:tetratricopeptide repeat protein [Acidithiobacillus concretivorus]MBU2740052.1 sel1 repeat family protein [Acidithiobacillus concretivorus]
MRARIVIPLALIGVFSVGNAYALTNTQAKDLMMAAAHKGNDTDLAKLESAAKSGDAAAQMWMGRYYWGAKKDDKKAVYWIRSAAAQGNARAEYRLGHAYMYGLEGLFNRVKGNYWLEKSAAQGYGWAEIAVGSDYNFGVGVPKDYVKAIYWYKQAAAHGPLSSERRAEVLLGGIEYSPSHSGPHNAEKEIYWYMEAAAHGSRNAESNLCWAYYTGRDGVPKDYSKAKYWYEKAVAQGWPAGLLPKAFR